MGVSWLLPKVVGTSAAARMMLLNDVLSAEEALRHDLTHVVEGDLAAATSRAAGMVSRLGSQHSAPGLALTKRQMKEGVAGTSLGGAIVAENAIQTYLLSREDVMRRARGVLAGLSKL
jgi:enoyl-CoA hydratase/carnithine racemase